MAAIKEYKTVSKIAGPLLFVENISDVKYNELVTIITEDGVERNGQILDAMEDRAVIQVFEGTSGLGSAETKIRLTGDVIKLPVSKDMLGRILSGFGRPIDNGPDIIPETKLDINGAAINPFARDNPSDFIQTGISAIDGMNTLVRGQKLPIFSGSGLPHNQLAVQIARQAKVRGENEAFAVVFAAMGITHEEASYFMENFENTGALERAVLFLNLSDDPAIERIITPRMALTCAEYLAYEHNMQVLVILTDMTNYCEALRSIAAAREEIPGRRGYPGYMYTDLSMLYERAGRIKGRTGSITQLPILTMPSDDITHPIADLTGYITEGQIVLGRELHRRGISPPNDVLPSLSRLMNQGIKKTREDHRGVADQLYASYAEGRDLRQLVAVVGEEALTERDRSYLKFADLFETKFVTQGFDDDRSIEQTLDIGWSLLAELPESDLKRIRPEHVKKYHPAHKGEKAE